MTEQTPPGRAPGARKAGHLLIIDDEQEIVKALNRQFRRAYQVYTALSADEGIRIMREAPVQVVISDQRMPGTTGTEFFRQIRTEYPDAVRLLLTGYADIEAVISAINDGNVFRYITKPWDPVELETIVQQAFERYNLGAQIRGLVEELQEANTLLEQRVEQRTAELAEANERLQQMIELKNEFMGMAAHDLRSPLSVIQGFASLMKHQERLPPEGQVEYLDIIIESVQGMIALLTDLLSISEIESGKIKLRPAPVDPYEFMGKVARFHQQLAAQKHIQLRVEMAEDLPEAVFDPDRIQQVLSNLLSNAFKYSESQTTVTVAIEAQDGGLRFAVTDQGQGIKPEDLSIIFDAFRRTSNRATAGEHSTGLGLAICKRIVDLSGGELGVESEVGRGSTFYFTLPLTPQDIADSSTAQE